MPTHTPDPNTPEAPPSAGADPSDTDRGDAPRVRTPADRSEARLAALEAQLEKLGDELVIADLDELDDADLEAARDAIVARRRARQSAAAAKRGEPLTLEQVAATAQDLPTGVGARVGFRAAVDRLSRERAARRAGPGPGDTPAEGRTLGYYLRRGGSAA